MGQVNSYNFVETPRNSENIKATVRPLCRIASVDHQIDVLSNFPVPKGRVAYLRADASLASGVGADLCRAD